MKRLITAIILVVFLIAISIGSNIFLNISTKKLNSQLEQVYTLGKEKNYEECKLKLKSTIDEYKNLEKYYLLVIRSTPLEDITEKINTLEYYLEFKDSKLFCIELKKTIVLINHILETEKPNMSNIF